MKKKVFIGVVSAAVILGGSIAAVAAKNETNTQVDQSKKGFITMEKAETIALKEVDGIVESIDLETKVGKSYYEVEIEKDRMDYDIYIDAVTGKTSSVKQNDDGFDDDDRDDDHDDDSVAAENTKTTAAAISDTEAIAIAEKAVNGKMTGIKKEHDDGILKYQVELHTNRGEAEVDVNAFTGAVIEIDYDDED
ncbi:PepSY domain-containing protein [Niallia oryzisoli]|uniref:PepSY domain-containing protein n=1 Tax=Niallia oryzisoli TaxID=1737571 RepID=A0ABZ2C9A4_9BACI